MKIVHSVHAVNKEEDRDKTGFGSRPRLRSLVSGLCVDNPEIKCDQEEWRPLNFESQFGCYVREFYQNFLSVMPSFFDTPNGTQEEAQQELKAIAKEVWGFDIEFVSEADEKPKAKRK